MSTSPPAYMTVSTTAQVAAVVTKDVANAGVDWVAICGSSNCGTFNPSHTGAGINTSYTAPPGVPSDGKVSITALSSTDHSKSAASSVVIISTVTGITLFSYPPADIPAGAVVNLGGTVAGDPANLGVDWTATCSTASGPVTCSPSLHSPAGGTVAMVVPQTIILPGTNQTQSLVGSSITITAKATADHNYYAITTSTITDPVSITITQAPPANMLTNGTASVSAVVTNDTTSSGVTWSVSCLNGPCGTITPPQSSSGGTSTFAAPSVVPSPNPQVTITAYANVAGTNVLSSVTVNIVAPISVKITQGIPNSTIVVNASASLAAIVDNDSANAGVDWTVTCGSPAACGSFSPTHTASGAATTFTAPSAVPAGGTVTITATSTSDPTKNDQLTATVSQGVPPNSLLQGQFVLALSARNSQNGPYVLGGVISGDGNGNITGGVVDLADGRGNASAAAAVTIVSPSTYSIGPDGRGQIHLTINTLALNFSFGVPGTGSTGMITLSVVFVTPKHALLAETDTFGSATGTLDLQNTTDLASLRNGSVGLNGTYSLQLSGTEVVGTVGPYPGYFLVSAMSMQASGTSYTLTGYTTDQSAAGAITSVPFTAVSQAFPPSSKPDQYGQISTSGVGINLGLPAKFNLDLWMIDATHFVVTDYRDPALGNPNVLIIGYLTAQPASPSLSSTYVFTEGGATAAAQPQVAGGILTCGSGGILDVVSLAGTPTAGQSTSTTCASPVNGRGLISISGAGSSGISQFAAYPTLDRGIYLIELDGGTAGTSGPSGAGVALQQTLSNPISSSALNGSYASVFSASTALGSEGFTAHVISDGVSSLSGTADVNSFNTTAVPPSATSSPGASLSGSFTTANIGRFPLTLTLTPASGQPNPQIMILNQACYLIDANTCLLLGLDATAPATGIMQLQNTGL